MQDYLYSTIGIVALIIHIIINPRLFQKDEDGDKTANAYRFLMISIFAYYITDALWGILAGLNNIPLLHLDTTLYYVAMAMALVAWASYISEYLDLSAFFRKSLSIMTWGFFAIEVVLLLVNKITSCFFWFDENDAYHAGTMRYAALWVQVGLFFLLVLITGWRTFHTQGIIQKRNLAISFFSLVMLLANLFQLFNPLLPLYAIGFLIGSCILHVYVVEDEREEYRKIIASEKILAEEANKAKTTFLFNMSHDIRTPMNAIMGFASMAKKCRNDPQKMSEYVEKIDVAGDQLLKLINQVLEMARIESGKVGLYEHPVDLIEKRRVFTTIYGELAQSKDITFVMNPPQFTHRYVILDEEHMDQIMNNIISNAIKYTRAGGKVTYSTVEKECDKDGYGLYVISVQDNGIGMSPEYLEHIYDEFSRENTSTVSHIQGTGLGMSIVKKVSELMGGTVEIESEKHVGTKVTISMPMKIDKDYENRKEDRNEEPCNLEGLKILLADDNEMNREITAGILEERGIVIDAVEDGDLAVEKIKHSAPGDYDLVLMDVQMPRMNGYDATKAIRNLSNRTLSQIPVVAMTANAYEEDKQNALAAGMNGHIAKPINISELIKVLTGFKK